MKINLSELLIEMLQFEKCFPQNTGNRNIEIDKRYLFVSTMNRVELYDITRSIF